MKRKPESSSITSNGKKIHIDVYSSGTDRSVILFIPGMGCYAGLYAEFLSALANMDFTVIGIDPPGLGQSEGRRGMFTFGEVMDVVSDVVSYAAAQFNARIGIMGTSLGGTYALYAALNDDRIGSVLCHGAMDTSKDLHIPTRFPAMVKFLIQHFRFVARIVPSFPVPLRMIVNWNHVVDSQKLLRSIKKDPLMVWYYSLESWISFVDYRPAKGLKELLTPLTIVVGDEDRLFPPAHCSELAKKISPQSASLRIVKGGHFLPIEYLPVLLPFTAEWFVKTL